MIASLNGILLSRTSEQLIVDVQGVGYKVVVSGQTFAKLPSPGQKVFLYVYTSVREDDIALFGFLEEDEKRLFQKLIQVNGIGPKLALTILSGIPPQDLVDALHREDLARLTAISGIGKKTAERMILDLKDKLTDLISAGVSRLPTLTGRKKIFEEAVSALINLGYTRPVAERIFSQITIEENSLLENVIREALRRLSETRHERHT